MRKVLSLTLARWVHHLSITIKCWLVVGGCLGVPALAQAVDAASNAPALHARAQHWLDQNLNLTEHTVGPALRREVVVGELDPRLHLAPCDQVEPFLPVGTRLWGKTRLGLRCNQGVVKWSVFLPITVKVFGAK
jgi:flagella basal body P-ring formation protein FlgA